MCKVKIKRQKDWLFHVEVSILSGQMAGVVLGVVTRAAVGDDHGPVVSVDPEASGGTARRHNDKHGDLELHCVVSHGHGEVAVGGHDHPLPLLLLQARVVKRHERICCGK